MNTITPGEFKDKLRGFRHLNLFRVLVHEQEIYIDQNLKKPITYENVLFHLGAKIWLLSESKGVALAFNTMSATSFSWWQHSQLLPARSPEIVFWEISDMFVCSLQTLLC